MWGVAVHATVDADPALRRALDALAATDPKAAGRRASAWTGWIKLCGARVGVSQGRCYLWVHGELRSKPVALIDVEHALGTHGQPLVDAEHLRQLCTLIDYMTELEVVSERQHLERLADDDADLGPHVIAHGAVGAAGVAAWQPPHLDATHAVLCANQPAEQQSSQRAEFVRLRVHRESLALGREVLDVGYFERWTGF